MAETYDIVIIGGGHNGLVCAAYLAKTGRKVAVLEAAESVGGAASTRQFSDGYSVSGCAHVLHLLHSDVTAELGLARHGLSLAANSIETVSLSADGAHVTIDGANVSGPSVSADDQDALRSFHGRMVRFGKLLGRHLAARPPRLVGGGARDKLSLARLAWDVRRLGQDDMRELLRIGAINIFDVLEEHFDNALLKGALSFDAVLGTHMGPRSPNSVFTYLYRLSGQIRGQSGALAIPAGGMGAVSEALAAAALAQGAVVRTSTAVTRVKVDHGRATGVILGDGEEVHAAVVVSNADPKSTFLKLVGEPHLETGFARRIHNIRSRSAAAKLHLALSGLPQFHELDGAAHGHRLIIAPSSTYVERAFDHAKYGEYSSQPAVEITLPSIHDASLAPTGKHVLSAIIQYAPYALKAGWDSQRDKFQQLVIDCIAAYAPGLKDLIVAAELLTPRDIELEYRITGGHWHHGELALDQFMMVRPVPGATQYATPIDGLYLCGAGTHPGGGVMGLAGRNAANEVIARERTL